VQTRAKKGGQVAVTSRTPSTVRTVVRGASQAKRRVARPRAGTQHLDRPGVRDHRDAVDRPLDARLVVV
jgi:hypothetical protein